MTPTDKQREILKYLGEKSSRLIGLRELNPADSIILLSSDYVEECCCGNYVGITQAGLDYLEALKK